MTKIPEIQEASTYEIDYSTVSNPKNPPITWIKVFFKQYIRMSQIDISVGDKRTHLDKLLEQRSSLRDFGKQPVSKKELDSLLYRSAGIKNLGAVSNFDKTTRMYPSAGARYPLEVYILNLEIPELPKGVLHYNVKQNTYEVLLEEDLNEFVDKNIAASNAENVSAFILFTAVYERSSVKYLNRAYRFIYLEAGHLSQNIYLKSEDIGLGCYQIGGYNDGAIEKLLDISRDNEFVVSVIAIGRKNNEA